MSWTAPLTWIANQIVTAAQLNTHVRDNLIELRGGGIAISGQTGNDFIYGASSTQLGRVSVAGPGGDGRVPTFIAPGWQLVDFYPVGTIYENATDGTNPATLLGFGTWAALAPGRVLVEILVGDPATGTIGQEGGEQTHILNELELPSHTHTQDAHGHALTDPTHAHAVGLADSTGHNNGAATPIGGLDATLSQATTQSTSAAATGITVVGNVATNQPSGGGGAHNNLQPYRVVYRWYRTT